MTPLPEDRAVRRDLVVHLVARIYRHRALRGHIPSRLLRYPIWSTR